MSRHRKELRVAPKARHKICGGTKNGEHWPRMSPVTTGLHRVAWKTEERAKGKKEIDTVEKYQFTDTWVDSWVCISGALYHRSFCLNQIQLNVNANKTWVQGRVHTVSLGGRFQQCLAVKSHYQFTTPRDMEYTSQPCCDKTMDVKWFFIANTVFRIVQNHSEKGSCRRF